MSKFKRLLLISLTLVISMILMVAHTQETVKVGMSGRYFPFTFVKLNNLQGFEVDVWNEIGKRSDFNVEFVTANFSDLFGMLEAGHIDTIANQLP